MTSHSKALVTGAAGFIGSHLVERLVRDGFRVKAFVHYNSANSLHNLEWIASDVRREIELFVGDVTDPFAVHQAVAGCDYVFHLASLIAIPYSYCAPAAYVNTNVTGTLNVLQACRAHGVRRLLHTSTSEVYGTAQYVPIDEAHPLVGQSPYSASKIAADKLVESFHLSFGLPVCTVRPFNTYGPRQSARAVIPTIVSQALQRSTVQLGGQAPIRDFTFVTDTVAGFAAAALADDVVGHVLNLGVGSGVSVGELVAMIGRLTGRELTVELDDRRVRPRESEVLCLISDNRKMRALTGWEPSVPLEEGLERVIEYMRLHPLHEEPGTYTI